MTSLTATPFTQLQSGAAAGANWPNDPSRARIIGDETDTFFIPPSAVEPLPATGPQLDELIRRKDRSAPTPKTPALSPRQANPSLDDVYR